jgi:hypothetical protein
MKQTAEELARNILAVTLDAGVTERMILVRLVEQGKINLGDIRHATEGF